MHSFQIGGNDQLGNIVSGYELIGRISKKPLFGEKSKLYIQKIFSAVVVCVLVFKTRLSFRKYQRFQSCMPICLFLFKIDLGTNFNFYHFYRFYSFLV